MGRQGVSTIVRRWARNFGWSTSGCGRRAGVAWVGIMWHGSCAARQVVWGSRRNTDERKRNDTTERSELFKCVSWLFNANTVNCTFIVFQRESEFEMEERYLFDE